MLNPLISSLVYQTEMLISYIFYSNVSEKRRNSAMCLLIGCLLFEFGAIANLFSENNIVVNMFVSLLIYFTFSVICFHVKINTGIFYMAFLVFINAVLDVSTVFLISALTNSQPLDYNSDFLLFILECTTSKILYFVFSLVLAYILKPTKQFSKLAISVLIHPLATLVSLVILLYVCIQEQMAPNGQYLFVIISMVLFISTILVVLTHQHQTEKSNEYMRMQNEFKRLQIEKSYYDILEQQNQQLIIYAHDVKNHLAAIKVLNTDPHISGYVAKLSERLDSYTRNCHSGNMLLDVIINKYVMECDQSGISFDYDVKLYNMNDIEDLDLVSILGNLMDNALEAAQKSDAKEIYLETTRRNAYHVLLIRNSSLPPKNDNGRLVTSKADSSLHGFGLKSVAKTLKKYHGDLQWDYDDASNTFTMTVMIGNPVNKNTIHT